MTEEDVCVKRVNASRLLMVVVAIGGCFAGYQAHQSNELKQEMREHYREQIDLLSATVQPRIAVDKNMRIRRASDSAIALFGVPTDKLLQSNLQDYLIEPLPEEAAERFGQYQKSGKLPHPTEWAIMTGAGRIVHVRMIAEDHLFRDSRKLFGLKLRVLREPNGVDSTH